MCTRAELPDDSYDWVQFFFFWKFKPILHSETTTTCPSENFDLRKDKNAYDVEDFGCV